MRSRRAQPFTAVAQSKKQLKQAQKLLNQIKLVDGPGSGLDADTLHGVTPEQLKASITSPNPQDTLTALKSVDGTGSGLDADTLQGLTPRQVAGLGSGSAPSLYVREATNERHRTDFGLCIDFMQRFCVERGCDTPTDVLVACTVGEASGSSDGTTSYPLARGLWGDVDPVVRTATETCRLCGSGVPNGILCDPAVVLRLAIVATCLTVP